MAKSVIIRIANKNYTANVVDYTLRPYPFEPGVLWQINVDGENLTKEDKKAAKDKDTDKPVKLKTKFIEGVEHVQFRMKVKA